MTDTTKQAATAKTAREVCAELVDAASTYWSGSIESCRRDPENWSTAFVRFSKAHAALRALLDAPEGAADRLASTVKAALFNCRNEDPLGPHQREEINAALAALRASPENLGGLQAQAEAYNLRLLHERTRERDSLKSDLAETRKERDALRAEVERLTKERDAAVKRAADLKSLEQTAWGRLDEERGIVERIKADLAAASRREALARQAEQDIRVLKDRAEAELAAARSAGGRDCRTVTAENESLRRQIADLEAEAEQNDLAALKGAPPPATEASISERIGPYTIDEVCRHADGLCTVTLIGDLESVRSAGARLYERVWVVAERAVKAPQAEG